MTIHDMIAEVLDEKPGLELETWDFDFDVKHACDSWYYTSAADAADWDE